MKDCSVLQPIIMFNQCKYALILCFLIALCTSCLNRPNGTYLIYNVTPFDAYVTHMPSGYTDSISNEMRNDYAGSKIKLTYAEEYVKVEQVNKSNNVILNKYVHKQLGKTYVEQHTVGAVTTTYTLRHHKDKLVLIVCKSIKQPKPADYPKSPFDFSYKPERSGLIICYLSKDSD